VTVDPNTNRFTDPGYSYDASGNMTADGLNSLVYDGENRPVSSASGGTTTSYTHTGSGLRVEKVASGTSILYIFSGEKAIAEYVNGSLSQENVYFGNQLLATHEGTSLTYHHPDHLSIRLRTDSSGNVLAYQGHYPFGETWHNTAAPHKWMFTSYERDSESGNDYALHRYHGSRLGRFSTPDPVPGEEAAEPQGLNRYAYVASDPVNRTDPEGLFLLFPLFDNCRLFAPRFDLFDPFFSPFPDPFDPIFGGFGDFPLPRRCVPFPLFLLLLRDFDEEFQVKVSAPDITCDKPDAKLTESACTVFPAARAFRLCGYLSACGLFSPGITTVSLAQIAQACKVPISKVKCAAPPDNVQIFARLSFLGAIAKVVRINFQSAAFK